MASSGKRILVLDFGSQYVQLIARRVREQHVFSEVVPHTISPDAVKRASAKGLIFSGGPASVYGPDAPRCDPDLLRMGIPVLGICYGMQLACLLLGGEVQPAPAREYGRTALKVISPEKLLANLPDETIVWNNHSDQVQSLSDDFLSLARTATCSFAAVKHHDSPVYGVQFHPEVSHTSRGDAILRNFLFEICGCAAEWDMGEFIDRAVENIRAQVGEKHVVCGLSGGVDSSVVAALAYRAVGERLHCIFVDNGLLRQNEAESVAATFRDEMRMDLIVVDASDLFLERLIGVTDPEEKRKIIGHTFIEVFREKAAHIPDAHFLAQGTLYPDVIESESPIGGPSATIKTHHNVGGLPAELGFQLVEPLRELFKDEVRQIGERLGLPPELVWRQPFPGPGLAVRIVGEVTRERLDLLRLADAIMQDEVRSAGLYRAVGQSFAVLLPIKSVGVMGDERSAEHVVALRAVETKDYMTADWVRLPYDLLARIANRIINEVKGVNRVVYDISSKPPSTIEWE